MPILIYTPSGRSLYYTSSAHAMPVTIDDVYTTIPDPSNQIYTSESETYARIPALPITVEVEVNAIPVTRRSDDYSDETLDDLHEPALPSLLVLNTNQVADHSHSRQASSSSSSVANISSPKPEKRQANSPLPPPPTISMDVHADVQNVVTNLDDLYAKVHKHKCKGSSDDEKCPDKGETYVNSASINLGAHENLKYASEKKQNKHSYETWKSPKTNTDPGYERIKSETSGYDNVNDPDTLCSSEPSYEVLKQPSSESDPNYEELQDRLSLSEVAGYSKIKEHLGTDIYSIVNKNSKNDEKSRTSSSFTSNSQEVSLDEPNYESMPSESISDPNYAALKSTSSESDPNYESVKYLDEPPYERLDNDSSKADSDINYEKVQNKGYEDIDTSDSSNGKNKSGDLKSDSSYEYLEGDAKSERSIKRNI